MFALSVALLSLPLLLGFLTSLALVYAPCFETAATPTDYGYEWEDVTLAARAGGAFRGFFIPGNNRAAIIIPPAGANGRSARLGEAIVLRRNGYSVFMFESRRCAGMGPLSLGYQEVNEVADALAYLQTRPEVDPHRIGIHGFSSAGATAVMAAARLPALRAVVAEGGYGDFTENALGSSRRAGLAGYFDRLYRWSSQLTYRLVTGNHLEQLSPINVIGEIAPRPIFLIYGSREVSLPGGRQQKLAAGDNAELWVVTGAGHGNYLEVAPQEFERRVVAFFDQALR
ncbi:MAG: prolyl oligopeptidase family serine peptidase [Anaerolineae bacterium]|nr:prolyl oligopeptidase family serine peptidase [Anaerolineae bacterium]